jgi:hypothetical protein
VSVRRLLACAGVLVGLALAPDVADIARKLEPPPSPVAHALRTAVTVHAAAPTIGQHAGCTNSGSGSSLTCAIAGSITAGSTLSFIFGDDTTNSRTVSTVSSGTNGAYTFIQGPISAASRRIWHYYKANVAAGSESVTVTFSGTGNFTGHILECVGVSTSAPLDTTTNSTSSNAESGTNSTHSMAVTPASLTTAGADICVHGGAIANASYGSVSVTMSPLFTGYSSFGGETGMHTTFFAQAYVNASGITTNALSWGSGNARQAANVVSTFVAAAAAGTRRGGILGGFFNQ